MYCIKKKYFLSVFIVLIFCKTNAQNLIPYRDNSLWGFCDTLGKVKVKPQFSQVNPFSEGLALVQKNKKYSYCDENGILKLNFSDSVQNFTKKHFGFLEKGKWGIVLEKNIIVKPTYNEFISWGELENEDGTMELQILAKKGLKYYTIGLNANKKPIIKNIKYEESTDAIAEYRSDFVENEQKITKRKAAIDSIAKLYGYDSIIYMKSYKFNSYDNPSLFYKVKKAGNFGIILTYVSYTDKIEIIKTTPIVFQQVSNLGFISYDFVFIAKKNNKVGLVKNGDEEIVPIKFDEIRSYNSEFAITVLANKLGCKIFNTVYPSIENKYDDIKLDFKIYAKSNWNFLVFKVLKDNKVGYVGENGVEYFKD